MSGVCTRQKIFCVFGDSITYYSAIKSEKTRILINKAIEIKR